MVRRPPRSQRTDTLFPYTTLFRANSVFTLELMIGISDRDFVPLAPNEGIEDAVFPHPARIGDTIRVESEVVALDRDARSVRLRHRALTAQDACIGIATREVRSEEHTSELQSLMRISYAVFCLKKKKKCQPHNLT